MRDGTLNKSHRKQWPRSKFKNVYRKTIFKDDAAFREKEKHIFLVYSKIFFQMLLTEIIP